MTYDTSITETQMLNFLIEYSGEICHSRDGECCWVKWQGDDEEEDGESEICDDPREAIQDAMRKQGVTLGL